MLGLSFFTEITAHVSIRYMPNRKQSKTEKIRSNRQITRPLIITAVCIVVGIAALVIGFAATGTIPGVSLDIGSSSTVTSPAQTVSLADAFGGSAVQFKARPAGTGKFYVVGKDIVDPNGKIFYGVGANIVGNPGPACPRLRGGFPNESAAGNVAKAKQWGWNVVRLNFWSYYLNCPNTTYTQTDLLNGIDEIVQEYTSQGIVVILGLHENFADTGGEITSLSDPRYTASLSIWPVIANKYKNNSYVWFGTLNEYIHDSGTPFYDLWRQIAEAEYKAIRDTGAENITVHNLPGWGQDINSLTTTTPVSSLVSGKCNVVYDWHDYGASGGSAGETANIAQQLSLLTTVLQRNIPVVIGEYGADSANIEQGGGGTYWDDASVKMISANAAQLGVSALWWHGVGGSANTNYLNLTTNRMPFYKEGFDGNNLTPYGTLHRNLGLTKPVPKTFTGILKNSNCASAP